MLFTFCLLVAAFATEQNSPNDLRKMTAAEVTEYIGNLAKSNRQAALKTSGSYVHSLFEDLVKNLNLAVKYYAAPAMVKEIEPLLREMADIATEITTANTLPAFVPEAKSQPKEGAFWQENPTHEIMSHSNHAPVDKGTQRGSVCFQPSSSENLVVCAATQ